MFSFVDAFYRNDITSGLFCPPHKITQPALQRKKNISLPQRKTNVVLSLSLMLQLHSEQMDPCFIFIGMHLLNWGKRKRGEKMQENESQERKQRETETHRDRKTERDPVSNFSPHQVEMIQTNKKLFISTSKECQINTISG